MERKKRIVGNMGRVEVPVVPLYVAAESPGAWVLKLTGMCCAAVPTTVCLAVGTQL